MSRSLPVRPSPPKTDDSREASCRHLTFENARRALEAGYPRAARSMILDVLERARAAYERDERDALAVLDARRAVRWLRWLDEHVGCRT